MFLAMMVCFDVFPTKLGGTKKKPVDDREWWEKDLSLSKGAGANLGLAAYDSYKSFVEYHGDNLMIDADAWLYPLEYATAQMALTADGDLLETDKISPLAMDICKILRDKTTGRHKVEIIGTNLMINSKMILFQDTFSGEWNTQNKAFTKPDTILFEHFIAEWKITSRDYLKQFDLDKIKADIS